MYKLGIDIGGTKINFVLLKNQRVIETQKILTPKNKKDLIPSLIANIQKFSENGSRRIRGIGIGAPGPLDEKGDLILNPPNLPCLKNTPLARIIEEKIKIKTIMENDANCFALGEAILGAGKGAKIVFGITLGTGVGGGIIINNKLYRGAFGAAGEVGHTTIKFDGPKGICGIPGCFEENWGSQNFFKKRGRSPIQLQKMTEIGDKKAPALYREYGRYLGIGLSNVINLLDPEIIVVGGGLANNYKFFIQETEKEIKKRVISPLSRKYVKIKKAALGDFGGAIGAALLLK